MQAVPILYAQRESADAWQLQMDGLWRFNVDLGKFDHDLTATEAWEMMVYLREIITLYSPTIQVSELYCSHLLYIHIHIVHIPYLYIFPMSNGEPAMELRMEFPNHLS